MACGSSAPSTRSRPASSTSSTEGSGYGARSLENLPSARVADRGAGLTRSPNVSFALLRAVRQLLQGRVHAARTRRAIRVRLRGLYERHDARAYVAGEHERDG